MATQPYFEKGKDIVLTYTWVATSMNGGTSTVTFLKSNPTESEVNAANTKYGISTDHPPFVLNADETINAFMQYINSSVFLEENPNIDDPDHTRIPNASWGEGYHDTKTTTTSPP